MVPPAGEGEPLIGGPWRAMRSMSRHFWIPGRVRSICLPILLNCSASSAKSRGQIEARFQDVGVGGGSDFAVSEPIFLSIAPMAPTVNTDQKEAIAGTYDLTVRAVPGGDRPAGKRDGFSYRAGDGRPGHRRHARHLPGKIVVLDNRDANSMTGQNPHIHLRCHGRGGGSRADSQETTQHVKLRFHIFRTLHENNCQQPQTPPPRIR